VTVIEDGGKEHEDASLPRGFHKEAGRPERPPVAAFLECQHTKGGKNSLGILPDPVCYGRDRSRNSVGTRLKRKGS